MLNVKWTIPGRDLIEINEETFGNIKPKQRIHLIKLNLSNPTESKIIKVIKEFPDTKRYIVSDNVKFYNDVFKKYKKKYYIENTPKHEGKLISFFRKNNKVLVNFNTLTSGDYDFCYNNIEDLIQNVEIIAIPKEEKNSFETILAEADWSGNCILL